MLRHEILTNFIHFQGTKKFDFQPGANIFIGQNNSGKSSVFEGARRCLGIQQSTSISSAHFPDKLSAATCIFSIDNNHKLFSSITRLPSKDATIANNSVYVKAVYETVTLSFGIDLIKETEANILVNKTLHVVETSKLRGLFENFLQYETSPDENKLNALLEHICAIVSGDVDTFKQSTGNTEVETTDCESTLRIYVDKTTVFTFAVRGIGPCQWSRSQKITNECKAQNYITAQERSEILQWYLENIDNKSIQRGDKERVNEYFDIITNNSDFEFMLMNTSGAKELVALNKRSGKRSVGDDACKPFPIMKVPDGITEAMNCAILLGVSDFKTVCLEEPEKGMHPQMIERLRDMVLRKIENKTVLITSHHPSFLDPRTITKLHIFKTTENKNGTSFNAYCGLDIEEGYRDKKTPRIITSDHFASVFFAERVLFVEGEGDVMFMSALKQLFLGSDDLVVKLLTLNSDELRRFRVFLCSLNIISLDGETQKLRFRKLCEAINTDNYFILDNDAIQDHDKSPKTLLKDFNLWRHTPDGS